jgi:hypothetical protein
MGTASNGIGALSNQIRENLGPEISYELTAVDPVFGAMARNTFDVRKNDIGRGWRANHTMRVSQSGAVQFADAGGDAPDTAWATANTVDANPTQTNPALFQTFGTRAAGFPGLSVAPLVGTVRKSISLVQITGNMPVPLWLLESDQLKEALISWTEDNLEGMARNVANVVAGSFYKLNSYDAIGVVSGNGNDNSGGRISVALSDGRTNAFCVGQFLDLYTNAGTPAQKNTNYEIGVVGVNSAEDTYQLILQSSTGGDMTNDLLSGYYLVPRGSYSLGCDGLENFVKASGSIFGVPVADVTNLKSKVTTSVNSLTESKLRRYLGQFMDKFAGYVDLDTIITTGGVTREYLNSAADLGRYQRQGAALDFAGGDKGVSKFSHNGVDFNWIQSRFCRPGYLYGIKTGDGNYQKYIAPRVPGAGTNAKFDDMIQFWASVAGMKDIFMPVNNTSGEPLQYLQCPFFGYIQIAPKQPQGIKLSGVTED